MRVTHADPAGGGPAGVNQRYSFVCHFSWFQPVPKNDYTILDYKIKYFCDGRDPSLLKGPRHWVCQKPLKIYVFSALKYWLLVSGVQSRVICCWSFECKLPWSWVIGHLANIGDILNNLHFNSTKYLNPNTAEINKI